jgi:hypothetical protein
MTDGQASFLLLVVHAAETCGGEVPSARELRELIGKTNPKPPSEKRIRDLIKILNRAHQCFIREGNRWCLSSDRIVTEPETAIYLLQLARVCRQDPEVRTRKQDFHNAIHHVQELIEYDLDEIYNHSKKRGYLVEVGPFIRVGRSTIRQENYLELLAKRLTTPQRVVDLLETEARPAVTVAAAPQDDSNKAVKRSKAKTASR